MTVESAYEGEDVPLRIAYSSGGNGVDPDDTNADATPDANITIIDNDDGLEAVSAAAMSNTDVGEFEYVWDTAGVGTGTYRIEITAEFSSETKIAKDSIKIR